jgi:hypothetical protein
MLVRLVLKSQRKYEQENLHNKTLLTPTRPVAKVAYGFIAQSARGKRQKCDDAAAAASRIKKNEPGDSFAEDNSMQHAPAHHLSPRLHLGAMHTQGDCIL